MKTSFGGIGGGNGGGSGGRLSFGEPSSGALGSSEEAETSGSCTGIGELGVASAGVINNWGSEGIVSTGSVATPSKQGSALGTVPSLLKLRMKFGNFK